MKRDDVESFYSTLRIAPRGRDCSGNGLVPGGSQGGGDGARQRPGTRRARGRAIAAESPVPAEAKPQTGGAQMMKKWCIIYP
jgi:hypothetical protein